MVSMQFREVHGFEKAAPQRDTIVVELRRDNWDDFHFRTMLHVTIYINFERTIDVGAVKILKAGMTKGETPLPRSPFTVLDETYCSLGQEASYYEMLGSLPEEARLEYLTRLRDAAASPAVEAAFASETGWGTSLLRFGQADAALAMGKSLFRDQSRRPPGIASFRMNQPFGYPNDQSVDFEFGVERGLVPGRCNVIIGYNGSGKTRLLSRLALAASDGSRGSTAVEPGAPSIVGADSTFGAVLTVAYSAFDTFHVPQERLAGIAPADGETRTDYYGWTYCGLRILKSSDHEPESRGRLKTQGDVTRELLRALAEAQSKRDGEPLRRALTILGMEPSFERVGVDPSVWAASLEVATVDLATLSTGHQIVTNILVQLASHLQSRSLVLVDEPETHLHPPLLATLLKALHSLLEDYDSFCVMATHSPVVLQEIPSRFVKVLDRTNIQNVMEPVGMEVFGENIGAITRRVFNLDNTQSDYQGVLKRLAESATAAQIESLFPEHGLSGPARSLVANYREQRPDS